MNVVSRTRVRFCFTLFEPKSIHALSDNHTPSITLDCLKQSRVLLGKYTIDLNW